VTNESTVLLHNLNEAFDEWAEPHESLFPQQLEAELTAMTEDNYAALNNGVNRAGFAGSQSAHETAVREVFRRLHELEEILSRRRYLLVTASPRPTGVCFRPCIASTSSTTFTSSAT
jgi:putative glutathione S-transferase